ncbi:flagellar hook protein [Paracoccus sp. p3-h83]|uniref:flagellar hook protein n=1 Tax=Paracoccus sp. p3-h83 TaxID=3342805 RepID=UPI0035B6C103
MNFVSVGDMARAFQLRHHSGALKTQLAQLSDELTTGRKQDTAAALRGDFTTLGGVEASLASLKSYKAAAAEATLMVDTMQAALGSIQSMTARAGPALIAFATTATPESISAKTADVHDKFMQTITALNSNAGGRYVLSGAATDRRPVAEGADILGWLRTAVSGQLSARDIDTAISAWFDAPAGGGGFVDLAYQGSANPLTGVPVAPGDIVDLPATATSAELRNVLKGLATGALLAEGLLAGDDTERARLTRLAGERILSADGGLIALQSQLGIRQQSIGAAETRNAAETATMSKVRSALAEADPYDTATALEAVRAQIETLHSLTARNARLSLANYLK